MRAVFNSSFLGEKKINRKFCRGAELSKGLLRLGTILACFHNWQNKNNGYGRAAPFPIATLTTVMVFQMKNEERSRGTGNNYYFYWSKANENGSGCFAHLFISLSVTVWLSRLLNASSAGFVHLFVFFLFLLISAQFEISIVSFLSIRVVRSVYLSCSMLRDFFFLSVVLQAWRNRG